MKYNYDSEINNKYIEVVKKVFMTGIKQGDLPLEDQLTLNEGHMRGDVFIVQSRLSASERKAYFLEKIIKIKIQLIKKKHCVF